MKGIGIIATIVMALTTVDSEVVDNVVTGEMAETVLMGKLWILHWLYCRGLCDSAGTCNSCCECSEECLR